MQLSLCQSEDRRPYAMCFSCFCLFCLCLAYVHARNSRLPRRHPRYFRRAVVCKLHRSLWHPLPTCPKHGTKIKLGLGRAEGTEQLNGACSAVCVSVCVFTGVKGSTAVSRAIQHRVQEQACAVWMFALCPMGSLGSVPWLGVGKWKTENINYLWQCLQVPQLSQGAIVAEDHCSYGSKLHRLRAQA